MAHVTCALEDGRRLLIAWDIKSDVSDLTTGSSCSNTWSKSLRLAEGGPVRAKCILGARGREGGVAALGVGL